ncbi:mRNA 3' end processing factor [Thoreauomyces humboldtii]|nr:mRNA 3' end processing factor [Thoreauomyces humboldtii]
MPHANAADLEAIRLEYRSSLGDLTFNSKPIITNLTIIAQENLAAAPAIVKAIEDQIRNAQPKQKLPVFYLLDSILKNVGGAYLGLFARNIVQIFATAFDAVEGEDRQRFVKVLSTWKHHPPGPLFAPGVFAALDNAVANISRQPVRRPSLGPIYVNPAFRYLQRDLPLRSPSRVLIIIHIRTSMVINTDETCKDEVFQDVSRRGHRTTVLAVLVIVAVPVPTFRGRTTLDDAIHHQ